MVRTQRQLRGCRLNRVRAATLAQARIRSDQLNASERELIADLFAVLESLVLHNELPAEAQGMYDQAVLQLAQRYD